MEWYFVVLLVIAGLGLFSAFVYLLFTNKKFRKLVYEWVCEAEETILGSKMGQEKFAMVVAKINDWLEALPAIGKWLGLIFTEGVLRKMIEGAVAKMKQVLKKEAERIAAENQPK